MAENKITDVHTRHCCILHGCKYGDTDCTVTTGKAIQEFTCEECKDDGIYTVERIIFEKKSTIIKIMSTDIRFLGDLMEYINSYNTDKPDSTIIRIE